MALVIDIADAIVAQLKLAPFLADADVSRAWNPPVRPEDVKRTAVFVIPQGVQTGTGNTRNALAYHPTFWVCFIRPAGVKASSGTTDADVAVDLMEQTAAFLYSCQLNAGQVEGVDYDPLFDPPLLAQGVFQGVLAFRVASYLDLT